MSALLQSLHLSPVGGKAPLSGLVSVQDDTLKPQSIEESVARRQALLLKGPEHAEAASIDYIFFRRFSDARSPQVTAYVVDNSGQAFTREKIAELHHRVWLNGTAPLLYVESPTQVDVFRCAAGPEFWDAKSNSCKYEPAATIEVTSSVSRALDDMKVRRFSAFRLATGTFWDDPENRDWARADKAAHKSLIQAATEVDRALGGANQPVMRRLLLLFIFTKYLEDRGVFPDRWFDGFHPGAANFIDVLKSGNTDLVRDMLSELREKFNGDIFDLPDVERSLTGEALREFVELLGAKTLNRQRYLWEQFSFRYIPVEVLSHLYQHFAQSGTGAIFTPPFVADLILDHAIPYDSMTGKERILDPTCGSGVFLVGAFRRLVHHWQSQHHWRRPGVPVLKGILKRSIFGVEDLPEAAQVAAFNLALAVCDALQPTVIWNQLTFDKLIGRNLFVGDFFEHLENLRGQAPKGFTTVIGNPPFKSELTKAAEETRRPELCAIPVPHKQIAYRVIEETVGMLAGKGRLCMIQPSGLLYNAQSRKFTTFFLANHTVEAVLDFASIRKLFEAADPKTVALLVRPEKPASSHTIEHLTFRRTKSVHERLGFELDHYDFHLIPQEVAETSPWIWKVNLLGGGRLFQLLENARRSKNLKTLCNDESFLESLSWWEQLLCKDLLQYIAPLIRVGQNSEARTKSVDQESFESYATTFVRLLGSIYKDLRAGPSGISDGIAYQSFVFGERNELEWPEDWSNRLKDIIFKEDASAWRRNRILRFYQGNTLIIIKPDRLRQWIPSTAIRDADEILADLLAEGC